MHVHVCVNMCVCLCVRDAHTSKLRYSSCQTLNSYEVTPQLVYKKYDLIYNVQQYDKSRVSWKTDFDMIGYSKTNANVLKLEPGQ